MSDDNRTRIRKLRDGLARYIPCDPEEVREDLLGMDLPGVLIRYMAWADRHVAPRVRRIINRDVFLATLPSQHRASVAALCSKIEAGDDITPFLSERIDQFGYVRPRESNGRPSGVEWGDKDYALNSYEAHHLHLGSEIKADGWSFRTRNLLYVTFTRDTAFLIMVGDHNSFDDGTLAQAVARARIGSGWEFRGIRGPSKEWTDKERNQLQRRGLSTFHTIDNQIVMGAAISTAGIASTMVMHFNRCLRTIRDIDSKIDTIDFGRELFERHSQRFPDNPVWSWGTQHCDLILNEESTRIAFQLVPWRR